jgi:hypothetical protein
MRPWPVVTFINMKAAELITLGKAVQIYYPHLVEEILPTLTKPEPILTHSIHLPKLLKLFCDYKGIKEEQLKGINIDRDLADTRRLFIAVVLTLYNPEIFTGIHGDKMKDNMRHELAELLQYNKCSISQETGVIKTFMDTSRCLPAWEEFRLEVRGLSTRLKNNKIFIKLDE